MMLEELQRCNYAKSTVKTYLRIIQDFASHFHQRPDKIGPQHLREYQPTYFRRRSWMPAPCDIKKPRLQRASQVRMDVFQNLKQRAAGASHPNTGHPAADE
jgi:integrase/recombinase XerD